MSHRYLAVYRRRIGIIENLIGFLGAIYEANAKYQFERL